METKKYFTKTIECFRSFRIKRDNNSAIVITNELTDSRFGINENLKKSKKSKIDSLVFLMYSKENGNLFI